MSQAKYWLIAGAGLLALSYWKRQTIMSFTITDEEALNNRNVVAFLRAIRAGESSQGPEAYSMLVYGGSFTDFSTHPRIYKPIPGSDLKTSAAGAYQITYSTWKWLKVLANVNDFTPASQDKMALAYLRKLGALADIVDGRYTDAIDKCRDVWEAITVPHLKARMDTAYLNYGGSFA